MDELTKSDSPMPASPNTERCRPARRWIILGVIAAIVLYIASPYYAFWRFTVALRAHDAAELNERVDFPSLRKSMKQQLNAKVGSLRPQNPKRQKTFDTLADAFGAQLIDSLVDSYLTPEGLAAFLANPKLPGAAADPSAAATPAPLIAPETNAPGERHLDWSRVHYAFFTGPRDFLVDVSGTKLRFHLKALRWQLRSVEVDLSTVKL
ncbi:MAG: DUF2939 domain-containing protein [Chthoniobacterales bacterium]